MPTRHLLSSLVCLSRLGHPMLHFLGHYLTQEKPEVQRKHLPGLKPYKQIEVHWESPRPSL